MASRFNKDSTNRPIHGGSAPTLMAGSKPGALPGDTKGPRPGDLSPASNIKWGKMGSGKKFQLK